MVQSKAATVDAYIAEADPARRPHLEQVRDLARRTLVGFRETMSYGMPTYSDGAEGGFAFASQKQYVSLYIHAAAAAKNAEALAGQDMGKCCLRYRNPAKIDYALLERLLIDTREADTPFC